MSIAYLTLTKNFNTPCASQSKISGLGISISSVSRRPYRAIIERGFSMSRTFGGTSVRRILDAVMLTPFVRLARILACSGAEIFKSRSLDMVDTLTPISKPSQIELLAKLYHALGEAIDGCDALTSDDEELTYWVNISRQIAAKIAPMRPLTSRDWAFKLSIDSEDYMIGAPVMEAIIDDIKRELAA